MDAVAFFQYPRSPDWEEQPEVGATSEKKLGQSHMGMAALPHFGHCSTFMLHWGGHLPPCSNKGVPLPLCPTEDAIIAHSLITGITLSPGSASVVTIPSGSSSNFLLQWGRWSISILASMLTLAPWRMLLSSLVSWRMLLPSLVMPWTFLQPLACTVSVTPFSCSALDVTPPLSYVEEITLPHCLVEDVASAGY